MILHSKTLFIKLATTIIKKPCRQKKQMAPPSQLKRSLGLFQVTVAGVGIILGAGIYALLGVAAKTSGNATWLAFLFSALIAMFTGLSYAELSSMFRGDAAEYDYIKAGLPRWFAYFIAISIIVAGIVSAATVALGFAGYMTSFMHLPLVGVAAALLVLMTLINFAGIKETSAFNTVSTIIEFIGLLLIIGIGISSVGRVDLLEMPHGFTGVVSSAALVFFAYMGFESIVKLSDETKQPEKTIPRALILSTIITSVVYVLVAIAAVSKVGWEALASSNAPLSVVAGATLGEHTFISFGIIAMFSTANTVLITMVAVSRQAYGMAKEGSLPRMFAAVHEKTRTPWIAIGATLAVSLLFALIGKIGLIANLTDIFLFLTFAAVNFSLIVLRYKLPSARRPFRCPGNIGKLSVVALLGFLSSAAMMLVALWNVVKGVH